ncbi:hypothetical protein PENSUB_4285 [Penicillium subrubescens]|uniref:Uncharacterized protein n=1 Tax=Penicillium subrubescens TaxID=1316194 RepID=A0A1Q5UCV4_9EURO|nr:hypothetical protein PENSUB_4285 [Penicillium subrubescens]
MATNSQEHVAAHAGPDLTKSPTPPNDDPMGMATMKKIKQVREHGVLQVSIEPLPGAPADDQDSSAIVLDSSEMLAMLKSIGHSLNPDPASFVPTFKSNWRAKTTDPSSFEKALVGWADSGNKATADGFEVEGDVEAGLGKNVDEKVNACSREADDISMEEIVSGSCMMGTSNPATEAPWKANAR